MSKIYLKKVKDSSLKNNCEDCCFEIYSKKCNKMYDKYGCRTFHFKKMTDEDINNYIHKLCAKILKIQQIILELNQNNLERNIKNV